ncbi:MAG: hypothetical protein IT210_11925 [Armatimonadetes bacterium]|nr:hypothetical protein [Armatimonadota bacterium]
MTAALDFLAALGPARTYEPRLCRLLGGVVPALVWCGVLERTDARSEGDGWVRWADAVIALEIGASAKEQSRARRYLIRKGLLEVKETGRPGVRLYRIPKESLEAVRSARGLSRSDRIRCAPADRTAPEAGHEA